MKKMMVTMRGKMRLVLRRSKCGTANEGWAGSSNTTSR